MVELNTKRLILKDLVKEDFSELSIQGNCKDIHRFNWYIPFPFTQKDAKELIKNRIKDIGPKRKFYELAVVYEKKIIGIVSFYDINLIDKKAKIGYWIGKDYRKKGFALESVKEIIRFGFEELLLNKISASVMRQNQKSKNLLLKFNFKKIGTKKQDKLIEGKLHDVCLFELLKGEYK
ncbi:MAG: GNAT family N-acetyltransferase [Nanoarchaeota archaeon]|nr:GNAT family N-acetyltransferase [Nanoarchaeota archaeon]MBU4116184.1 GNAT family N-acetyltransferase [Nanoarchaeota archaeon]